MNLYLRIHEGMNFQNTSVRIRHSVISEDFYFFLSYSRQIPGVSDSSNVGVARFLPYCHNLVTLP